MPRGQRSAVCRQLLQPNGVWVTGLRQPINGDHLSLWQNQCGVVGRRLGGPDLLGHRGEHTHLPVWTCT